MSTSFDLILPTFLRSFLTLGLNLGLTKPGQDTIQTYQIKQDVTTSSFFLVVSHKMDGYRYRESR